MPLLTTWKCVPLLWAGRKAPASYTRYFALGMQLSPALQSPFSFHLGCGYDARKKKKKKKKKNIYIYIYIYIYICVYIYCNPSRYFSRKYAYLTCSYSLALFMHACSDSAICFFVMTCLCKCFCLHLLLVHGGVKKVY